MSTTLSLNEAYNVVICQEKILNNYSLMSLTYLKRHTVEDERPHLVGMETLNEKSVIINLCEES